MTSSQLSVSIDHVAYQAPKGDGCKRCRLLTARPQDERGTLNDLGGSRDDNKRGRKLSESVPRPGQGGETHTYTLVRPSCISPKCDDMWEVGHTHTHTPVLEEEPQNISRSIKAVGRETKQQMPDPAQHCTSYLLSGKGSCTWGEGVGRTGQDQGGARTCTTGTVQGSSSRGGDRGG